MDPEQYDASLMWFTISLWLALTLSVALYFSFRLFGMDPDAAGFKTFLIGGFGITPMAFVATLPYARGISRACFGFWDRRDQRDRRRLRNRRGRRRDEKE